MDLIPPPFCVISTSFTNKFKPILFFIFPTNRHQAGFLNIFPLIQSQTHSAHPSDVFAGGMLEALRSLTGPHCAEFLVRVCRDHVGAAAK